MEKFFNINVNIKDRDINIDSFIKIYEDEFIKVEMNYAHLGMTFIYKKKSYNYRDNIDEWDEIFTKRDILVSFFK